MKLSLIFFSIFLFHQPNQLVEHKLQSFSDALSTALSALYAKIVVIIGIALPITELLSQRIPAGVYQGFYVYLYFVSISFVVFIYAAQLKKRAVLGVIKDYRKCLFGFINC